MPLGSAGRAASWFSERIRSCRAGSRRKASLWMKEMELLERSILFSFAEGCRERTKGETGTDISPGPGRMCLPPCLAPSFPREF